MSRTETRRINIYINGKEAQNSGKALRAEFAKARAELNKTSKSAANYQDKLNRFRDADKLLSKHNTQLRGVSRSWQQFKITMGGVIGAMAFQQLAAGIGNFFKTMVSGNAELSDSFADVRKTTGLSLKEIKELSSEFKSFNTRTSRSELLKLAEEAGRLGITGKKNIKNFVAEANQINVALGDVLGDGAVLAMGKLSGAFGKSMNDIGSAINELGASTKAQEGYMVSFAARMQGTAVSAKVGAADVLGYAATLDELGLKAEMSSTALNNFFLEFIKDSAKFEDSANLASGSLNKMIGEEGTNQGFIHYIKKLKEAYPEQDKFLQKLEEVGVSGARKTQVFLALSNNLDMLAKNQKISNKALAEGTSLTDEYNIKNNNLAANLEKVQRYLKAMFINSSIMTGAEKLIGMFAKWVKIKLSDTLIKEQQQTRMLGIRIMDLNVGTQERTKLMLELKRMHPKMMANINAETTNNAELLTKLNAVNAAYLKRILLARKQEEIEDLTEVRDNALIKEAQADIAFQEEKLRATQNLTDKELLIFTEHKDNILSIFDQIQKAQGTSAEKSIVMGQKLRNAGIKNMTYADLVGLKDFNEKYIAAAEERKEADLAIQAELRTVNRYASYLSENEKPTNNSPLNGNNGNLNLSGDNSEDAAKIFAKRKADFIKANAEMKKAIDDLWIANLEDEEQKRIDKAALDYSRTQQEIHDSVASESLKNERLAAEKIKFNNEIDAITEEFELKRQEKKEEAEQLKADEKILVEDALLTQRELELKNAEMHYDELIRLAKKHKYDSSKIEQDKAKEIAAINKFYDDQILAQKQATRLKRLEEHLATLEEAQSFTRNFANGMVAAMDLLGIASENMSDFQKGTALFQLGIDTAVAIAAATRAAAQNPANAITGGASGAATFASIMGIILPNMAAAKGILTKDKRPSYDKSAPQYGTGFASGILNGPSHNSPYGGMPVLDPRNGETVALFEGNETLLSAKTRKNNPEIVDALIDSSMNRNGAPINSIPYLNSQNQSVVNFDSFSGNTNSTAVVSSNAYQQSSTQESSNDSTLRLMEQTLSEISKMKQNPAPINITQLREKEREIETAKSLGGYISK